MEEVVSRMNPVDACRLSVVAKSFRSAAESDAVWERLLPNDYEEILCRVDSLPDIYFASKKDLYLFLIGNPLLIDANTKIFFWLDKWSGKKCFMIPISIKLYPEVDWNPSYESSFREIYGFHWEEWFGIRGKISTSMLSPDTTYTAYLVHKWDYGFGCNFFAEDRPAFEVSVGCSEDESVNRVVYLDRKIGETCHAYVVERIDGWLEVELGEYFNKGGENKDLEMSVVDVTDGLGKTGFNTQRIEIRPKHG
ncbi:Phloem protein [Heracleum sosnowskyi]|uniref:Phloem protein n=1 Tax=Heracleum sosnowskyi TaxID=360622 RepID=A0AAD8I8A7_9APIA|nr:Phloem protein [Heracleum sosnowskyi]